MANPLYIEEITERQVIVGLHDMTALEVARNSWLDANVGFITLSRGKEHVLTVIGKDGIVSDSITWGGRIHDILNGRRKQLKEAVLDHLKSEHVFYDTTAPADAKPNGCKIMYNPNYKAFQATFAFGNGWGGMHIYDSEVATLEDMIEVARGWWPEMPEPAFRRWHDGERGILAEV